MKTYIETINNSDNYISFNKYRLIDIPYLSLYNYFINSPENIYFLILSIIQLSTYSKINLLPSEWSPSGPFSTTIPLTLCYFLELFGLLITYFKDFYKTYSYNYLNFIFKLNTFTKNNIKSIRVGDIIIVNKNCLFPVDGIVLKCDKSIFAKVSLSNLNGECDIICKNTIVSLISDKNISDIKILNIKNNKHSIKLFNSIAIINNKRFDIDHKYFVPGGSINKGETVIFLVTEVGENIRSYTSSNSEKIFKNNFINSFISNILTSFFVPLLQVFCLSLVTLSLFYYRNFNIIFILEKIMQSWILLNGIVPFSIKIILIINRSIQSYYYSNNKVEYLSSSSPENFSSINRVICDKTGTITKNELLLTHISYKNRIYDNIDNILDNNIPFQFICKIVISLHCKDNIYDTEEDKIIGHRIMSLGTLINYRNKDVMISNDSNSIKIDIKEMEKLEFDCSRKLSSVIFGANFGEGYKTYIVTKGSIMSIKNILKCDNLGIYNSDINIFNNKYPFLRTISFAIKEIDNYDKNLDPKFYENQGNYEFLSVLGIQDELQSNIKDTIKKLQSNNKKISICTGDRKETALNIAEEIGILNKKTIYFNSNLNFSDISDSTFIFSSKDIENSMTNFYLMSKFYKYIMNSHNFVSFSLIPKDKQYLANIFEAHNRNIIAVGDGNNDIPMLKTATVAVGINNNHNTNVINSSHISIDKFEKLSKIQDDTTNFYNINIKSIFSICYKTLLINSLIYLFVIYNNFDFSRLLFNFIELQCHHLVWGVFPIITNNFTKVKQLNINHIIKISSIIGILNCFLIYGIIFNINPQTFTIKNLILLLTILSINTQFIILYGLNRYNVISSLLSIFLGILYMFSTGYISPNIL